VALTWGAEWTNSPTAAVPIRALRWVGVPRRCCSRALRSYAWPVGSLAWFGQLGYSSRSESCAYMCGRNAWRSRTCSARSCTAPDTAEFLGDQPIRWVLCSWPLCDPPALYCCQHRGHIDDLIVRHLAQHVPVELDNATLPFGAKRNSVAASPTPVRTLEMTSPTPLRLHRQVHRHLRFFERGLSACIPLDDLGLEGQAP